MRELLEPRLFLLDAFTAIAAGGLSKRKWALHKRLQGPQGPPRGEFCFLKVLPWTAIDSPVLAHLSGGPAGWSVAEVSEVCSSEHLRPVVLA